MGGRSANKLTLLALAHSTGLCAALVGGAIGIGAAGVAREALVHPHGAAGVLDNAALLSGVLAACLHGAGWRGEQCARMAARMH